MGAQRFNQVLVEEQMLICPPSLSIFGAPLSTNDLMAIAAEARDSGTQVPLQPGDGPAARTPTPSHSQHQQVVNNCGEEAETVPRQSKPPRPSGGYAGGTPTGGKGGSGSLRR